MTPLCTRCGKAQNTHTAGKFCVGVKNSVFVASTRVPKVSTSGKPPEAIVHITVNRLKKANVIADYLESRGIKSGMVLQAVGAAHDAWWHQVADEAKVSFPHSETRALVVSILKTKEAE